MAQREIDRLTARKVETLKTPGVYLDGGGLRLLVDANGNKRWRFRFAQGGKTREMGLGGFHARGDDKAVSLALARARAAKARAHVQAGRDPIVEGLDEKTIPTFGEAADAFLASLKGQWRNEKHKAQWEMTLRDYAAPIRATKVDQVDTVAVLKVLAPLWQSRPETASRLRGRIERVLDAAKARGERMGENPARWRGHLDHLLPTRQKLTRGHHTAKAFADVPAFVAQLQGCGGMTALALEFAILTAARSGEVIGARWSEIDLTAKVWTVPAVRMKAGREHRVPLTARAVAILEQATESRATAKDGTPGAFVFPTVGKDAPLSTNAFRALILRLTIGKPKPGEKPERAPFTAHGFRSSFRDWAGEVSTFPREVAEAALAHRTGDAVELAYRRGDALAKRVKLMEAWAGFVARGATRGNVTAIRAAAT